MTTSESNNSERITFTPYLQPLTAGSYEIRVDQEVSFAPKPFSTKRRFYVASERFSLTPPTVGAVFPPDGSLGDHSNVLPQIILGRGSLPWERSPDGSSQGETPTPLSWLLLLLFDEAEKPVPRVISLRDLHDGKAYFPEIQLEPAQKPEDQVTVIDVQRRLLEAIMPGYDDLRYLAHVRRGEADGDESAVIVGNRLPRSGSTSTVHLVSVEGRYYPDPQDPQKYVFDFGAHTGPTDLVRLVSLASWRFACVDEKQTFAHMVHQLSQDAGPFRLPRSSTSPADTFLEQGLVPARHMLRQGGSTISWYRGPFVTGPVEDEVELPVRTSDSLLRYHADVGMFDVSYAAAWELGRLLALQSSSFSTALYEWKRRRDQSFKSEAQLAHPLTIRDIDTTLPDTVGSWFDQLAVLRGVPFKYLIPDENLLPRESIRFFWLDPVWMRCLLDGAYSIGRITKADFERDQAHPPRSLPYQQVTGALIRSDVVAGYPGLLIDAFSDKADSTLLPVLRMERLSENVLLCLFKGNVERLDIHQQPEMLHFAVELSDETKFTKSLRKDNPDHGSEVTGNLGHYRTIPVAELVKSMYQELGTNAAAFTSGHFAIQMIESAERISFCRRS
ncbi:MAG TPA: hypothetical protein VJ865_13000 [Gemmatimonadaceae bacterium]|nr:hypothetical protein [Gemmatimonadaceae bacterium]